MNYFIKGDAANADKIKAAFEKLGYDTSRHFFNTNSVLYFTFKGKIRATTCTCTPAIIKTHPDYQELELPVEPKFKVGDWVVCWNKTYQILDNKSTYIVREINGLETRYEHSMVDENGRIWTIQDAKDGDVLATDNGWICIFKAFDGCVFSSYCFMDSQKWFCGVGAEGHTLDSRINGNIHPATKEQRILFFKKMQEAGYQWYAGEKELRKIQLHYDIANFQPFDKVLVRDYNNGTWKAGFYSHRDKSNRFTCAGSVYNQCIPFNEDTKHLLGITAMPDERFINW